MASDQEKLDLLRAIQAAYGRMMESIKRHEEGQRTVLALKREIERDRAVHDELRRQLDDILRLKPEVPT